MSIPVSCFRTNVPLTSNGSVLRIWQPDTESYPLSKSTEFLRPDGGAKSFEGDYAGVVDSALALVYNASRKIAPSETKRLFVTGGPSANRAILERTAAIWNCQVTVIGPAGAALGAAVSGIAAVTPEKDRDETLARIRRSLFAGGAKVLPDKTTVNAYHGENGYIRRLLDVMKPYMA